MNNNHGRRRTRRVRQQRKQQKTQIGRILLTVGLMALIAVVSIGGTIAWLTADTTPVTNTFTASDIELTLIETKDANGNEYQEGVTNWTAQMIPGKTYDKNPKVTVENATTVDIYLFVQATETGNPKSYLTYEYEMDQEGSGWEMLTGEGVPDYVWYRSVAVSDDEKSWDLIKDDKVSVSSDLKKELLKNANGTISFQAYAIQKDALTTSNMVEIWTMAKPTTNP